MPWRSGELVCSRLVLWDGQSWSSSAMLDEVIFLLIGVDNLSCNSLPIAASRGLCAERVKIYRKLEGVVARGSKVLVELHRKSSYVFQME